MVRHYRRTSGSTTQKASTKKKEGVMRTINAKLRATRDLLLPKLISGETDVSDLEITVPEVETAA